MDLFLFIPHPSPYLCKSLPSYTTPPFPPFGAPDQDGAYASKFTVYGLKGHVMCQYNLIQLQGPGIVGTH